MNVLVFMFLCHVLNPDDMNEQREGPQRMLSNKMTSKNQDVLVTPNLDENTDLSMLLFTSSCKFQYSFYVNTKAVN